MQQIIKENPIISIIRQLPLEHTIDYAQAVYNGGIKAFEIASNSTDAIKQISLLRSHFGSTAIIGAGTVTTLERAEEAMEAGAQFLLTPSTNRSILEFAKKNNIPILPGVMTPTDVDICYNLGYKVFKLFPAATLPLNYIQSLKGPFDDTDYVAVGGVTASNISQFFQSGFIGVGIGSNLIPREYIEANNWSAATQYISELVTSIDR
ncbi:MAG: bifunctional 4-hydroxy-2-oxoglutarate aldolase/2-dehydro-3-deoxy-phosphogluconate aldolase [Mobilitalea sp.]